MSIQTSSFAVITAVMLAWSPQAESAQPVILGVGTLPISEPLQQHLGSPGRGVLVDRVIEGSKAELGGIVSGDVLVAVNGGSIHTPQQLSDLLWTHRGQTVEIDLVRNQQPFTISVSLDSAAGTGVTSPPPMPSLPHVNPSVVPDGFPPEIKARIEEMQRRMQRSFNQPLTPGGTMQIERFGIQCETDANGTRCEDLDGNPIDPSQGLPPMTAPQPRPPPSSAPQSGDPLTDRLRSLRDTLLGDEESEESEDDEDNAPEGGLGGPPA